MSHLLSPAAAQMWFVFCAEELADTKAERLEVEAPVPELLTFCHNTVS